MLLRLLVLSITVSLLLLLIDSPLSFGGPDTLDGRLGDLELSNFAFILLHLLLETFKISQFEFLEMIAAGLNNLSQGFDLRLQFVVVFI